MARFETPCIQDNSKGWGPNTVPLQFKDMPYQPFSKSDRLGKICDWTGGTYQDRRQLVKYNNQFGAGGTAFAYYHEEDETSFHLVDASRNPRPAFGRGRRYFRGGRGNSRGRGYWNGNQNNPAQLQVLSRAQKIKERDRQRQIRKFQQRVKQHKYRQVQIKERKEREFSVTVSPDWRVIEEMENTQMAKLCLPTVGEPTDLLLCGTMEYYDKACDRLNVKNQLPLKRIDRIFHTVTTTDDPIIRKLVKTEPDVNVFATDSILATLMCSGRSQYSWDIVIQKVKGKIFLDKRDNTEFDLLTVSETSAEPPQEEGNSLNAPRNLALEATFVNQNFSQQVLKSGEENFHFSEKNPFAEGEEDGEVASVGYKYRKWDLGDDVILVVRCEHDAVLQGPKSETQFINIKALNEWDSKLSGGVDWRQKLDAQRGAVLANELKNNACKLAKWTVQALLASSDLLKFGFVTRFNVKNSSRHVILGTQHFRPSEFAAQIKLSMANAWGIVRCIIDLIRKQEDGKFLIVKDPNKRVIRLYSIPDNTFESEDDYEENNQDSLGTTLKA